MNDSIIQVRGLCKSYNISHERERESYTALRDVLTNQAKKIFSFPKKLRNEGGFKKINTEEFWALKDVNFDIQQGDRVGIIGRNGAGKSTLLKILSRITDPTKGEIKIKGRVASLLEVGTGFHPELTGRENIYLNGAILGMSRAEIKSKFDEIVAFAEIEKFLDTPVKRYSSGMYVRLAFAVAAHLEPEVLVVDEVLAVGDAQFQKKCLGKMNDVSKQEGRTVLFVSHNMAAVKELCNRGIVLNKGQVVLQGTELEVVNYYQNSGNTDSSYEHKGSIEKAPIGNDRVKVLKMHVAPLLANDEMISISSGFEFLFTFYNQKELSNLAVTFELRSLDEIIVFHHGTWLCQNSDTVKGVYNISGKVPAHILNAGVYKFNVIIAESYHSILLHPLDIIQFEVLNESQAGTSVPLPGITRPLIDYTFTVNPC
jgi:lipopolysaccharide transport system ATP-binding protein